jgi:hypothetical protein
MLGTSSQSCPMVKSCTEPTGSDTVSLVICVLFLSPTDVDRHKVKVNLLACLLTYLFHGAGHNLKS